MALLFLTACEDREVARKRNEDRLPVGCKIIDLDYGELRTAVVCEGRKTTTSLRSWSETIYIWDDNLKMMMPHTNYYNQMNAEISSLAQ